MPRVLAVPLLLAALALPVGAAAHPLDVTDTDHDGVRNEADNCPDRYNPRQQDNDGDAQRVELPGGSFVFVPPGTPASPAPSTGGDACDTDDDADGAADTTDNCRFAANPGQEDADRDGDGDACDAAAPAAAPGPADLTAPRIEVRVPRRLRSASARAGLVVGLECSEGCRATAVLRDGGREVGSGSAALAGAGRTFVFVRYAKGAARHLLRSRRARVRLSLTVDDASGNRTTRARRITLRR